MRFTQSPSLAKDLPFWKVLVLVNGLVPLGLLSWDAMRGQLSGNTVNFAIHTTGIMSLLLLVSSLAITPLRRLTGWNRIISFRRTLGLLAFFYACIHVSIYIGFDRALSLRGTIDEIIKRRYLQVGFAAIVLMLPLAITSTNGMVSRLGGKRWKFLHRLAYIIAVLSALHYFLLVKSDIRQPMAFAGVLAVLFAARLAWNVIDSKKAHRQPTIIPADLTRKFWKGELQVARLTDETPDVRTFRLISADGGRLPFDYQPGQYLSLELDIDGKRVKRCYTIASTPTRYDYCELTIKREGLGTASRFLHQYIQIGDLLKINAPAGKFVFTGDQSDSVVLIAGGVGITPLMSIARYLTDLRWSGDIYFLIAAKSPRDIIFRNELMLLQERVPNFHVHITLSRVGPDEVWTGTRGRIDAHWLNQTVPHLIDRLVYLCGPNEMMSSTRELLVEIGVAPSQIRMEAFVPGIRPNGQLDIAEPPLNDDGSSSVRSHVSGRRTSETTSSLTVHFEKSGISTPVMPEATVLEAAEQNGVNLSFECRSGICGQCKIKLRSGSVTMECEDGLTSIEKAEGWILPCQSHCQSDVTVEA